MVIRAVHGNQNHGSQRIKNLILAYNHVSQKNWKNQITRTRKLWVLYWFFHENHKLLKAFEIMWIHSSLILLLFFKDLKLMVLWCWDIKKKRTAVHSNDHTTLVHTSSQTQSGNPSLPLGRHPPTHQLPNVLGDDEITFRRQLLLLYLLSLACTYTGSLVIKFTSPPPPPPPPKYLLPAAHLQLHNYSTSQYDTKYY
jgi:hypothetical protein